jgi:hypothetical protein
MERAWRYGIAWFFFSYGTKIVYFIWVCVLFLPWLGMDGTGVLERELAVGLYFGRFAGLVDEWMDGWMDGV